MFDQAAFLVAIRRVIGSPELGEEIDGRSATRAISVEAMDGGALPGDVPFEFDPPEIPKAYEDMFLDAIIAWRCGDFDRAALLALGAFMLCDMLGKVLAKTGLQTKAANDHRRFIICCSLFEIAKRSVGPRPTGLAEAVESWLSNDDFRDRLFQMGLDKVPKLDTLKKYARLFLKNGVTLDNASRKTRPKKKA